MIPDKHIFHGLAEGEGEHRIKSIGGRVGRDCAFGPIEHFGEDQKVCFSQPVGEGINRRQKGFPEAHFHVFGGIHPKAIAVRGRDERLIDVDHILTDLSVLGAYSVKTHKVTQQHLSGVTPVVDTPVIVKFADVVEGGRVLLAEVAPEHGVTRQAEVWESRIGRGEQIAPYGFAPHR